jgi:hypothetical protein
MNVIVVTLLIKPFQYNLPRASLSHLNIRKLRSYEAIKIISFTGMYLKEFLISIFSSENVLNNVLIM